MQFLFRRTDQSYLSRWWWTIDHVLLVLLAVLVVVGFLSVSTASPAVAVRLDLSPWHFITRHLVYTVAAVFCMIVISGLSHQWVWRFATGLLMVALFGICLSLLSGVEIKGATRWVYVGPFSLQPSEFLKPALIILCAWFLAKGHEYIDFPGFLLASALYGFCVLLVMMQPDLGMSVVITAAFFTQIILAGCPLRYVGVLAGVGMGGLGLAYLSFDHVRSRIDRFLNPESGDTFQVDLSLRSFIEGGVFGKGPGQGDIKMRLPDAHSDFTFAVLAEEMGLIAVLLVLALYSLILLHIGRRLLRSASLFAILAGGGLLTLFATQIIVHIGSSLQLLPAKGMTLPFLSYGGSSLLAIGITFGMLLALTRQQSGGVYASHHLAERLQEKQNTESTSVEAK